MNVLIANSELQQTKCLANIIQQHDSQIKILGNTSSVDETIKFLNQNASDVDLTFLEMQLMSESSFEILKQKSVSNPIVFT